MQTMELSVGQTLYINTEPYYVTANEGYYVEFQFHIRSVDISTHTVTFALERVLRAVNPNVTTNDNPVGSLSVAINGTTIDTINRNYYVDPNENIGSLKAFTLSINNLQQLEFIVNANIYYTRRSKTETVEFYYPSSPRKIYYNGTQVNNVYYNGTQVNNIHYNQT